MSTTLGRCLDALGEAAVRADEAAGFAAVGRWNDAALAILAARVVLVTALSELAATQDCGDRALWLNAVSREARRRGTGRVT